MNTFVIIAAASLAVSAMRGEVTFRSTGQRTHLLELFTSEGCSSCPSAEQWFSELRGSTRLWKDVVPVAFHVDYWDGLGWPDRFASKAFTSRQRTYAAAWGTDTVYTPGFVLNGREWKGRSLDLIPSGASPAGVLIATIGKAGAVSVSYLAKDAGPWTAHIAALGLSVGSKIKAGENRGRQSVHDFVVLDFQSVPMTAGAEIWQALAKLPALREAGEHGLAAWVTGRGEVQPAQVVGGNLAKQE